MVPSMYGEVEDEAKDGWGRRRDDERLQQLLDDDRICVELRFSFAVSTTVDSEWMPACGQAVTVTRHLVHSVQHSLLQPHAAPAGRFKQLERFWKREL